MVVMVTIMQSAGALAEEPTPIWPAWPPKDIPTDRLAAVEQAVSTEKEDPSLSEKERTIVRTVIEASKRIRGTRSHFAGKVPKFKFMSSDGWIVSAEESSIIATALRRFADGITEKDLGALEKQYQQAQQKLLQATMKPGEVLVAGNERLGLSLSELKQWIREWAAYNDVAAHNGGYVVQ
jgi:hypothetical protein